MTIIHRIVKIRNILCCSHHLRISSPRLFPKKTPAHNKKSWYIHRALPYISFVRSAQCCKVRFSYTNLKQHAESPFWQQHLFCQSISVIYRFFHWYLPVLLYTAFWQITRTGDDSISGFWFFQTFRITSLFGRFFGSHIIRWLKNSFPTPYNKNHKTDDAARQMHYHAKAKHHTDKGNIWLEDAL